MKKFALLALLICHIMVPVKAEIKIKDIITPVLTVGVSAVASYIITTHLIQEAFLVKSKYPHAQTWYDAMDAKYPVACLQKKLFLQKIWGVPVNLISWCSTINHIYFPQNALIRINSLYGMKISNQILSAQDQLFLAEQEFILLHEAGHIEHSDIIRQYICTAILGGLVGGLLDKKKCSDCDTMLDHPKHFNIKFKLTSAKGNDIPLKINEVNKIYNVTHGLITASVSAVIIKLLLSRYHERNADDFAYTHGDDNALLGGLSFFESELVDPLFNIENEQPSPYIAVDSTVGKIAQSAVSIIETPVFYIGKTFGTIINSTDITRWLYDASRDLAHPGGPARAAAIRKEMQRRSQAKAKTIRDDIA